MQDTELYEKLLGIESPWSVERVSLDVEAGRVDVWVEHPARQRWSRVRNARAVIWLAVTMPPNVSGVTWTRASFKPTSMPGFREWNAPSMASDRSTFPGRKPVRASPC